MVARSCFSDPRIARLLGENFLSILVDVDEHPDAQILGAAMALALRKSVGLPANLILDSDGRPFFATGPLPAHGDESTPGLFELLTQAQKLAQKNKDEFEQQTSTLHKQVAERLAPPQGKGGISEEVLRSTFNGLARSYDSSFFGFGMGPKFAQIPALRFLLRYGRKQEKREARDMALLSLGAMSSGGFFDQLGGGFFHQSRDRQFLLPLYEKRLGENVELVSLYLSAYRLTGLAPFRRVAMQTLDFVTFELSAPEGGFFSRVCSEDLDGSHYLFTRRQIKKAVGEPSATHFCQFYGISELEGDERPPPLSARRSLQEVAKELGLGEADLLTSLEMAKTKVLDQRRKRGGLSIDDRLMTAENALAISSLSRAAIALWDPRLLTLARRAAKRFFEARLESGLLPRQIGQSTAGTLDDQVLFFRALVDLHQVTLEPAYLDDARKLVESLLEHFVFRAPSSNESATTITDGYVLTSQARTGEDQVAAWELAQISSPFGEAGRENPAGVFVQTLVSLAHLSGEQRWLRAAQNVIAPYADYLRRTPHAACGLVLGVDALIEPSVLVLLPDDEHERAQILSAVSQLDDPRWLVSLKAEQQSSLETIVLSPRGIDDFHAQLETATRDAQSRRKSELFRTVCSGKARAEAAASHLDRHGIERRASIQSIPVSALGLGTYRIGLDKVEHARAVRSALDAGINFIDTSPSFALGDSQRLIGEILGEYERSGRITRDSVYIMCKLGVAIGQEAERLEARRLSSDPPAATCPLGQRPNADPDAAQSLAHGAFCLDPSFLEAQISLSLARLGLDHLDACLLNSPEHLVLSGMNRDDFQEAMVKAFAHLEYEVSQGRIGCYGLVSTALSKDSSPLPSNEVPRLYLDDLIAWASRAAAGTSHFSIIECAVNLVERQALERDGLFERARARGISTIACRPLSAMTKGALLRLTDVPNASDGARAEQLGSAKYRVAALEAEFETTFAVQLRLSKRAGREPILPFSGPIGQTLDALLTRQQFEQAETTLITPRLRALLAQLDQALSQQGSYRTWKAKYIQAVGTYLACVREACADKNRALLAELQDQLLDTPLLSAIDHRAWKQQSWSRRAVQPLLLSEALDVTLVGARHPNHIDELLPLLS